MIVCWLLKTSPVNVLFYLGYLVPKVPSTTYYTESWKVAPYYQRIEGICSKVVVLFLSIPRNSPGVGGVLSGPTPYIHSDWTVCPPAITE